MWIAPGVLADRPLRPDCCRARGRGTLFTECDPSRRFALAPPVSHGTPVDCGLLVGRRTWSARKWSVWPGRTRRARARVTNGKTPHLPGRFQGARLACSARHSGRSRQWDVRIPVERRPQPPARARTRGREEDLPTQHPKAGQEPRFPAPDVDARRPCHRPRSAAQGPPPPVCVRAARRKRSGASGIGPLSRRCGARRSVPAPGR